jgi:hypothetical protein
LFKLTSVFGSSWGDPPLKRDIDWEELSRTSGVRLLVGWQGLVAASGPASSTTVSVETVLQRTPLKAFEPFRGVNPGHIGFGVESHHAAGMPDGLTRGHAQVDGWWGDNSPNPYIAGLDIEIEQIEVKPYSRLRFTWGCVQRRYPVDGPMVENLAHHPIPVGSTTVEINFSRHPDGD